MYFMLSANKLTRLTPFLTKITGGGTHILLGHLRTETDPVSETFCFLVSRIPDDGQSPKTQ
jgi:hypothetical protein